MRFGFVTCVELGLACMDEIYNAGGELTLAVTLPDDKATRKSGRIYLDDFCNEHDIDVLKVPNINDSEAVAAVHECDIDWLFIVGWSQIAGEDVLAAPTIGAIGMHPTLLPQGRGRAAIPWTILKGLTRSGVTMFQLDRGVDSGPILYQEAFDVASDETASTLYKKVARAHRGAIRSVWSDLAHGTITLRPQDESRVTYWEGRSPGDGQILEAMSVADVDRLVRATTHPYPGAFIERKGEILRVWRGRPARVADPAPRSYLRLHFADGVYDALDTSVDPIVS